MFMRFYIFIYYPLKHLMHSCYMHGSKVGTKMNKIMTLCQQIHSQYQK